MLAHFNGQQVIYTDFAKSLEVSYQKVKLYLDVLTDFYMVRQLQPWAGNTKKRLVKYTFAILVFFIIYSIYPSG